MADCEAVGRKLDPKINRIAQTPCRLLPNAATRNSREQEGRLLPTLLFNLLFFQSSRPGIESLLSVRCMRSSFVESTNAIPLGNRKGKRPCPMPPGHCVKTLSLSLFSFLSSSWRQHFVCSPSRFHCSRSTFAESNRRLRKHRRRDFNEWRTAKQTPNVDM